jgi:hypothetical protein
MTRRTIRVDFTVNAHDLAALLLWETRNAEWANRPTFATNGEIRELVRDALYRYGMSEQTGYWADYHADCECDDWQLWANELIARAYPQLVKD